jgi:hypothetical protein
MSCWEALLEYRGKEVLSESSTLLPYGTNARATSAGKRAYRCATAPIMKTANHTTGLILAVEVSHFETQLMICLQ